MNDRTAGIPSDLSFPDASKARPGIRLLLKRPYPVVMLFAIFIPIIMCVLLFPKKLNGV